MRHQRGLELVRRSALRRESFRVSRRAHASICSSDFATLASAARCIVGIDRRVDLQPALRQPFPSELLDELLPHFFLEILSERLFAAQHVASATFSFDARSNASFVMMPCSCIAFSTSARRATARDMLTVGAFTDGAFTSPASSAASDEIEVGGRLAEIPARCGLRAVKPVAEINLVQVQLEDLVLRVHPLDSHGEGDLPELPP